MTVAAFASRSIALATIFASSAFAEVAVTSLGTLGGSFSTGTGLSESGLATGYSRLTDAVNSHAFRYSGGPLQDLGTGTGTFSIGEGINDSGLVVGYSSSGTQNRAVVSSGNSLVAIGPAVTSQAFDVNNAGVVVGYFNMLPVPFIYSQTGGFVSLGLPAGSTTASARAISNSGLITGNASNGAFVYQGTPGNGGAYTPIGTLPGDLFAVGEGINDSGQVAGYSYSGLDDERAFLYSPGSGMVDLGTLGGGSLALDIDSAGNVVGYSAGADAGPLDDRAWLSLKGGELIDLDAWLDATDPALGAQWTLISAVAINDAGQILGNGFFNGGNSVPFILDASDLLVPEPSSLGVLSLACVSLLRRSRGRRAVPSA